MDFFALSVPGGSGTNDAWHFSWTVDSSHPLIDTTGSFFGMSASNRVNYLIGIEVNCDGAPRLEMWQNGQPWEREFAWNVDYFIAMFATGTNSMEAQLWRNDGGNSRSLIAGSISVTSRVVGFRRQIEFALPATAPVPVELRNNATLCLYLLSVRDIEGSGTVLDGVGLLNHNVNCEGPAFDLSSLGSVFINTEANAKTGGRPTDPGTNERQSLSYPARTASSPVSGQACNVNPGLAIDGQVDSRYVLLTEAAFAAPYAGGSANSSDFVGESSARTYTLVHSGATNTVTLPGGQHGDIANVYAFADTNYLYLLVSGPTALGWELEPDLFNLFIALDMPGQNSGVASGSPGDVAPGAATAPANRLVNFKGWDPDYMVELVWRGVSPGVDQPANLYAASAGSWSNSGNFLYRPIENTATNPVGLHYSRSFPQYEFAIPWNRLGRTTPPSGSEPLRLGVYTTGDENMGTAGVSRWDIADQAPGIGQGCGGEGCHERVGDDALDDDALASTGLGDRTPYVGRTYGAPGLPPATDNSSNDVDTIEEYFEFAVQIEACAPAVNLEKLTNGQDADTPSGPLVGSGSLVTWTFSVVNAGNVGLTNVVVYDDQVGGITNRTGGDTNGNGILDTNEVWTFTATGAAITGQYMNMGSVTARVVFSSNTVTDTDPSHYFGASPGVRLEKLVNGQDADIAPGPTLPVGSSVSWIYQVTNTGNVALTNVVITDDRIGAITNYVSGDANNNRLLDLGEVWLYTATGTVTAGAYVNTGLVQAVSLIGQFVSDTDPAHHFGGAGGIDIEKATNGQDADMPPGPYIAVGAPVTWTYVVRNTGNTVITNVAVYDDDLGPITNLVSGDTNGDRNLGTNETWTFTASGIAQAGPYANVGSVSGRVAGVGTQLSDLDPSHYVGSTAGYTLQKTRTSPVNRPALLGEQVTFVISIVNTGNLTLAPLPLTDTYESGYLAFAGAVPPPVDAINDGLLTWTNVGPLTPGSSTSIVVQFTATQAFVGTRTNLATAAPLPPVGHPPLPPQTSTAPYLVDAPARVGDFVWHDLNGNGRQDGGEPGVSNTLVTLLDVASNTVASVFTDSTGAYQFTNLLPGTYIVGFSPPAGFGFTAPDAAGDDASDSDVQPSTGFTAPFALASGANDSTRDAGLLAPASIGDFVWLDINKNGIQDPGESGYGGVVLSLYDTNNHVLAVTTTAVNGAYAFTNLPPGAYILRLHVPPATSLSSQGQGGDPQRDSDFSPFTALSAVITLVSGQHNPDIDAGLNETLVPAQVGRVDGVVSGGVATLIWETVSEYGTAAWIVERQESTGVWVRASELLPAVGGVLHGARYAWPDPAAVLSGTNIYRLVEIDVHGVPRPSEAYAIRYPKARRDVQSGDAMSFQAVPIPYRADQVVAPAIAAYSLAAVPGTTAIKIAVRENGLYRVTAAEIAMLLGVDASLVKTGDVAIEHVGRPVPAWRPQGDVVFYGQAYQSMYTDLAIYKLRLGPGTVLTGRAVMPPVTPPMTSFADTLVLEQQSVMRPDIFFDRHEDIWLWHNLISGVRSQFITSVTLPSAVSGKDVRLTVHLKGGSQTSGNGMHGVRLDWNGQPVATASFFGLDRHALTVDLPAGAWNTGANQVKVLMTPPPGVTFDHVYVDRIEAAYTRSLVAVSNRLVFSAASGPVQVSGFSSAAIEVWDVTDPWQPVRLTGITPVQDGASWMMGFVAPRVGRYIAAAVQLPPVRLSPWLDHDLKDNTHRVDYLVVHGEGLASGAAALAADRAGKGLRTMVVPIEAVYNEFNHGIVDGRALPALLGYAFRQWETSPRYVVLAGDGSLDFRNRMGAGDALLPTPPDAGSSGVFASDHRLGDVNQDGLLDVAVGRLPVVNDEQLHQVLDKIRAFEAGGAWRDRVLIATDNSDVGGNFLGDGDIMAAQLTNHPVTRADIGRIGAGAASAVLKAGLAEGQGLTVYIGHGMRTRLAEEGILTTNDVPALDNTEQAGVLLALGCLMGTFGDQGIVNIGEKLVTQANGSAAMIGSASLVNNRDGNELGKALVRAAYHDGEARLGDAWIDAINGFASTASEAGLRTYQVLGDPALSLGPAAAPRGGPTVTPVRPSYEEWRRWAFAPIWDDLGLDAGAVEDADADGSSNYEEYMAGTDPTDADSELILVTIRPMPDGRVALSWPSVPGRTYRIERGDMRTGVFVERAGAVAATAPLNTWVDDTAPGGSATYRVSVR